MKLAGLLAKLALYLGAIVVLGYETSWLVALCVFVTSTLPVTRMFATKELVLEVVTAVRFALKGDNEDLDNIERDLEIATDNVGQRAIQESIKDHSRKHRAKSQGQDTNGPFSQ